MVKVNAVTDLAGEERRTLVIAPHPDDEALGLGAYLRRHRPGALVFLADGVPREPRFYSSDQRYDSPDAYRAQRQAEALRVASRFYRVQPDQLHFLNAPDMESVERMPALEAELTRIAEDLRPCAIWSPAYEGGHPDHDVAAFLAARLARRLRVDHWEYALYHYYHGFQQLSFLGEGPAITRALSLEEMAYKKRLLATYASQTHTLRQFRTNVERYRRAPGYDFSRRPVTGAAMYEVWQFPVTPELLVERFSQLQAQEPMPLTAGPAQAFLENARPLML